MLHAFFISLSCIINRLFILSEIITSRYFSDSLLYLKTFFRALICDFYGKKASHIFTCDSVTFFMSTLVIALIPEYEKWLWKNLWFFSPHYCHKKSFILRNFNKNSPSPLAIIYQNFFFLSSILVIIDEEKSRSMLRTKEEQKQAFSITFFSIHEHEHNEMQMSNTLLPSHFITIHINCQTVQEGTVKWNS